MGDGGVRGELMEWRAERRADGRVSQGGARQGLGSLHGGGPRPLSSSFLFLFFKFPKVYFKSGEEAKFLKYLKCPT